jgi:hypothetical protein
LTGDRVPNSKELAVGFIQVDWKETAELRAAEIERLREEVRRLQELAGSFYQDMGGEMSDYMFCKHYWSEMEEHPWLKAYNPYPEGSPYFPKTQKAESG